MRRRTRSLILGLVRPSGCYDLFTQAPFGGFIRASGVYGRLRSNLETYRPRRKSRLIPQSRRLTTRFVPAGIAFIGLGAVWAGGISNLVDRIFRQGRVTDFMFISVGPIHTGIFNVADVMIMIGIAAIAVSLCGRRHGRTLYGANKA